MATIQLSRENRRRAVWFAMGGNVVPIAVACLTNAGSHHPLFYAGAAGACIAPLGVLLIPRRHKAPFYAAAFGGIPALAAMQSYTGGVASGYAVLMMMAMVWFGLQATRNELGAGLTVLVLCSFLPMLVIGPPAYPVEWGHATLLVMIGTAVAGSLYVLSQEMLRLAARLRGEALVDDLTKVLNRRGWRQSAAQLLARAERDGSSIGVVTVDLDEFKRVNDTMGHDAGDRVLVETAERLRAMLRGGDIVARLGGDEFVAMLTDANADTLQATVKRLREATPVTATFSAGLAVWDRGEDVDGLLRRVDVALYEAKSAGGGSVAVAPVTPVVPPLQPHG